METLKFYVIEICSEGSSQQYTNTGSNIAWWQTGDKLLSAPVIRWFTDAIRHSTSIS